jgi:NADPH:quinone reductase-like Zn-dependent oxidoreductase
VFVGYYVTTWLGGFGVCWTAVTVAGLDGVALLQQLGADTVIDTSQLSSRVVNALIAAEINELLDWVRLPLVIATTPALSRRLRAARSNPASQSEQAQGDDQKRE